LIVLIANAHPYLDPANLSSSLALEGVLYLAIRTTLRSPECQTPKTRLPFTTEPIRCHRRVRQACFIGTTPSGSLAACLKTSFSRSVR